jgi:hypothetical protein
MTTYNGPFVLCRELHQNQLGTSPAAIWSWPDVTCHLVIIYFSLVWHSRKKVQSNLQSCMQVDLPQLQIPLFVLIFLCMTVLACFEKLSNSCQFDVFFTLQPRINLQLFFLEIENRKVIW